MAKPPTRGVLQDIDPAELRGGVLESLGERVAVEDVRGEGGGGDALGGELADEIVELVAVTGDQGDVVALGAEGSGDGQTQLGAGSDDGDAGHSDPSKSRRGAGDG